MDSDEYVLKHYPIRFGMGRDLMHPGPFQQANVANTLYAKLAVHI